MSADVDLRPSVVFTELGIGDPLFGGHVDHCLKIFLAHLPLFIGTQEAAHGPSLLIRRAVAHAIGGPPTVGEGISSTGRTGRESPCPSGQSPRPCRAQSGRCRAESPPSHGRAGPRHRPQSAGVSSRAWACPLISALRVAGPFLV